MARPKAMIDPAKLVKAFADHGLSGASAERLAQLAGVAKPTLYAHGHTKESLYLLAVDVEVERLLERLYRAERLARGRSARDRATAAAHAILNHAAALPDGLQLLARSAHEGRTPAQRSAAAAVARVPDRISTVLRRDLTADGLDASLAPTLARAIWGATLALTANPTGERRPNRERVAAVAASCVPSRPSPAPEEWPASS
ncbi:MAG: TetR/AcrR family transcriptional regulator [Solirubrobacteraceae bacterium]